MGWGGISLEGVGMVLEVAVLPPRYQVVLGNGPF